MEKIPQINTFEQEKTEFEKKLQDILNTQVTIENINDFAITALDKLISLNDNIIEKYQKNEKAELEGKELEDAAYDFYKMETVDDLLDRIQNKAEQIDEINAFIKEKTKKNPKVIVPPDKKAIFEKATGDIPWEKKKIIPRLTTLLYLLETDFAIPKEKLNIEEGQVLNEQMRKEPYFRVEIDQLGRLVYICIEEGNVTYIFDQKKLKEYGIEVEKLDIKTKEERKELLLNKKNIGTKVIQSKNWRERVTDLLSNEELSYEENLQEKEIKAILDFKDDLPIVDTDPNSEWYGFWTDENGNHWGNREAICDKIGITPTKYKAIKKKYGSEWESKKIRGLKKHPTQTYIFEKIINYDNLKEIKDTPKAAREDNLENNQWEHFYTDENGTHWGPISSIGNKLGVNNNTLRSKIKQNDHFQTKKLVGRNGEISTAYSFEEIKKQDFLKQIINTPQVSLKDKDNEWKGFLTESHKQHRGTLRKIGKITQTDVRTIKHYAEKYSLKTKKIKDEYGHERDGYIYEEIINIPELKNLIKTPNIQDHFQKEDKIKNEYLTKDLPKALNDRSNNWHGFWTDENGNHWSSTNLISKKIGCSRSKLNRIISKTTGKKSIKGLNGKKMIAYSYEDIIKLLED